MQKLSKAIIGMSALKLVFWLAILIAAIFADPVLILFSFIFLMISLLFLILDSMQITINHKGWMILKIVINMILFIATCVISGLFALKAASFRNYRTYSADITTATFASVLHIVYMVDIILYARKMYVKPVEETNNSRNHLKNSNFIIVLSALKFVLLIPIVISSIFNYGGAILLIVSVFCLIFSIIFLILDAMQITIKYKGWMITKIVTDVIALLGYFAMGVIFAIFSSYTLYYYYNAGNISCSVFAFSLVIVHTVDIIFYAKKKYTKPNSQITDNLITANHEMHTYPPPNYVNTIIEESNKRIQN